MAEARSQTSGGRPISAVPYLPGLDGVRALAVIAVILYHAGVSWMPGGFLGVEVFFAISGYLITLLLLAEHERTGRISIRQFYGRRARRLLPALIALLIAVATLYSMLPFLRQSLARQRGALFWGLFYGSNWFQIARHQSYFDANSRPPLLRHLWSLAVEEQFYIVWPVLMVVIIKLFRQRLPQIGMAFAVLALFSALLTAILYDPANPNRAYLGTDTRAAGLLFGAAMAMVWRPYALARGPLKDRGRLMSLIGLGGIAILVLAMTRFHDVTYTPEGIRGYDALYYGGFLLVDLATMMVIASTTHLKSMFGRRVLGMRPLAWLGTRSYGLYLWHWPVFQLTRPGKVDDGGDINWTWWRIMVMRLVITFVLTELSYRLIETPIRKRRVKAWLRGFFGERTPQMIFRRRRWGVGLAVASVMSLFVGISVATAHDSPTDIERSLAAGKAVVDGLGELTTTATVTAASVKTVSPPATVARTTPGETAPPTTVPATTTTVPPTTVAKFPILAIGDSVMLGAAPVLRQSGAWVDAVIGRQLATGLEVLKEYAALDSIGDVVVIHLGNNGPGSQEVYDQFMEVLKNTKLVIFMTCKVPKPWQEANNGFIFNMQKYPNVKLIDWNGLSQTQDGIFYSDGTHLREPGQQLYAQYIADTIKKWT